MFSKSSVGVTGIFYYCYNCEIVYQKIQFVLSFLNNNWGSVMFFVANYCLYCTNMKSLLNFETDFMLQGVIRIDLSLTHLFLFLDYFHFGRIDINLIRMFIQHQLDIFTIWNVFFVHVLKTEICPWSIAKVVISSVNFNKLNDNMS